MSRETRVWRVIPWDAGARPGAAFTPSFVPRPTGRGRFDLPGTHSAVLYLAETPEHAVAEVLRPWRGGSIGEAHLVRAGLPLALVPVDVSEPPGRFADLCDPECLADLEIQPDRVASRLRAVTQPIARAIWDRGYAGLRWWSRFWGDWHTRVAFVKRTSASASFGAPEPLTLETPAVLEAARLLGAEILGG